MAKLVHLFLFLFFLLSLSLPSVAATFSGNAQVYSGANSTLSWDSGRNALSVSCWFKLSIPSGTNLTEDMTILVNQHSYSPSSVFAYLLHFSIESGNIEFVTRGSSALTNVLIARPYLERWYHVAIVRSGESFTFYVDGRPTGLPISPGGIGNTANSEGLTIGGWGNGRYLFGEVQEVAVAQVFRSQAEIKGYLFRDQSELSDLSGYYKLAYSTNTADRLRNFAPAGGMATVEGGQVAFEETSQSGEQSAFDSRRNGGRDALAPLSGAFSWEQVALSRPTPGIAFDFRLGYSSANAFGGFKLGSSDPFDAGSLGPGWRHSFETRLLRTEDFDPGGNADAIGLMNWNGSLETWDLNLGTGAYETRHKEYRGELSQIGITNFQWVTPERLIYTFQHPNRGAPLLFGRLVEIRDFNSNSVRLVWSSTNGTLLRVIDSASGVYDFKYNTQRLLTNVTFREWSVNFTFDSQPRLISKSITNASGIYINVNTSWQFTYSTNANGSNLLERIIDPRGNTNVFVQYDQYGRKTNETDAIGRATRTEYGVPGKRQIRHTDPATNQWIETYDRKHRLLVQRDPLGNETSYTYDEAGNRTSITEPLGWKMLFAYDERANVIARTNALGEITRWAIHSFFNKATNEINAENWTNHYEINANGNLMRHFDELGTLVSYTYASNGLVLTSTDANTNTTRFGYDTNGFLISRTDPATNTTTFAYNDVGWKLSETDPLYNWTDYDYDLNGNVVRITDPRFRRFYKSYDGNGNLLAASDAKGRFTTNIYDAANQKIGTIDRTGTNTTWFAYTSRGKLERMTNALGHVTSYFYDAANRLTNVTDALMNSVVTEYDANGNEVAMIDKVGQRWTKRFDRLNRVIAESDPLGNTRQTTYDPAGRIKEVFTPNGYPSTHFYDGRGRLIRWIDTERFEWKYTYDGNANIIDIEDALHGHYVMTYGNRNERLFEQNQDTNIWRYSYDELLRLKEQRDPNGTTRTIQYDEVSRVKRVDFNTSRYHTFDYDANNNVEVVTRRDGVGTPPVPTRFMYDVLDRPFEQSDVHQETVGYGYDAIGRITSIIYPGGKTLTQSFDALHRLTNQVFQFGPQTFATSYAYDKAGRLIQRTYPNGVVQSNAFDTAGRITGLGYLPSSTPNPGSNQVNIALTYAYDRNGNKTGGTEKGTLDWQLPVLTDERANFTPAGKLTIRTITTNAPTAVPSPGGEGQGEGGTWSYSYDSSGNMTNAANGPQSYSLTYDEDNRTTSITYSTASTNVTIANRYDALGRRVSRTLNGNETDYVLDLSGDMERILCDADSAGQITAWYIHGPDLAFKVDASGTLLCYHADAQANIIALSSTNGITIAQYAFTPYGRVLGSTNYSLSSILYPQPYLFVGSQGVMEELPGLYFMRARYYSAEAGVFLSTDPVKKIGPGWKPNAFVYANGNSLRYSDPNGEWPHVLATALAGAILSTAVEIGFQTYGHFANGEDFSGSKIAGAAVSGAIQGAFAGVGIINPAASGVAGFAGTLVEQALNPDEEIDVGAAASSMVVDSVTSFGVNIFIPSAGGRLPQHFSTMLVGARARTHVAQDISGGIVRNLISDARSSGIIGPRPGSPLTSSGRAPASQQTIGAVKAYNQASSSTSRSSQPSGTGGTAGATSSGSISSGSSSITIQRGDTLSGIARRNNTTVGNLTRLNGISDSNRIYAGARLRLR